MSTIRDITEVTEISTQLPEADTHFYVEHGGFFRRATPAFTRETVGLGGIVVVDGVVCMEIEEVT